MGCMEKLIIKLAARPDIVIKIIKSLLGVG
jgi:hypothetical protein